MSSQPRSHPVASDLGNLSHDRRERRVDTVSFEWEFPSCIAIRVAIEATLVGRSDSRDEGQVGSGKQVALHAYRHASRVREACGLACVQARIGTRYAI